LARKVETYVITDEGRDKGKSFLLTEMSATKSEDWAVRAILALSAANSELPEDAPNLGMAGLAEIGIKKLLALPFESLKPLMDELMECVKIVPDPIRPQVQRSLIESDIEEVSTRLKLKWQVLQLHLDFLPTGALSNLKAAKVPVAERPLSDAQTSLQ
jgi:hypothetical protein